MRLILDIRLLKCAAIVPIVNGRLHTTVAEDFLSMLKCHPFALFVTIGKRRMTNERENVFDKDKGKNRNRQT